MEHFPGEKAKVGGKAAKRAQAVALPFARAPNATSEGNTLTKHSLSFEEWEFSFPWELWYLGCKKKLRKKKLKLLDLAIDIQMKVEQVPAFSSLTFLHKPFKLQKQISKPKPEAMLNIAL